MHLAAAVSLIGNNAATFCSDTYLQKSQRENCRKARGKCSHTVQDSSHKEDPMATNREAHSWLCKIQEQTMLHLRFKQTLPFLDLKRKLFTLSLARGLKWSNVHPCLQHTFQSFWILCAAHVKVIIRTLALCRITN